jgi:hypothetical protein
MRKIIAIIAAAVATLGAFSGVASADQYGSSYWSSAASFTQPAGQHCVTPWMNNAPVPVYGFTTGSCTAHTMTCPTYAPSGVLTRSCRAFITADIETYNYMGSRVTLNARLRKFNINGVNTGWIDRSCAGVNHCAIGQAEGYFDLAPGDMANTICNGTYAMSAEQARVHCVVYMAVQT